MQRTTKDAQWGEETIVRFASIATFVVALLGAGMGQVAVLPFALVFSELVIYPLAAGVGGLFAALAAAWAATLLAADRTSTRLLPAVGVTEAGAVLLAVLLLAYVFVSAWSRPRVIDVLPIVLAGASGLVLATVATVAALRFRSVERRLGRDLRLTLLLLAVGAVGIPVAFTLAVLGGLFGA